jgi:peptidoglycan/LPS O-acetylase OafA/YrhL
MEPGVTATTYGTGDTRSGGLANLDFLRIAAVILVFLAHLGRPAGLRGVSALGHLGVLLFFVHTSLVLMMSMERLPLDGGKLWSSFMLRRIFRIYPLSIFFVAVMAAIPLSQGTWDLVRVWLGWKVVISNLLLVLNLTGTGSILGVMWSLPFEVQMYALLPLLFLWLRRKSGVAAALFLWAAGVALALAEYSLRTHVDETHPLLLRYLPCFLGGLLAWQVLKNVQRKLPGWLWPVCVLAEVALYRVLTAVRDFGPRALTGHAVSSGGAGNFWWPESIQIVVEAAMCALLGLSIPWFLDIQFRPLKTLSKWIARYSYGIYLVHTPALWLCFAVWSTGSRLLDTLASVALTGALSVACFHLLEDPLIGVGKRLANRWWPAAQAPIVPVVTAIWTSESCTMASCAQSGLRCSPTQTGLMT